PRGKAELIQTQRRLFHTRAIVEERICVKGRIAQELEHGAVDLVGAGLHLHAQHASGGAAELGGEVGDGNLEFLDGIHDRSDGDTARVEQAGVVIDAVENEVVGGGTLSGRAEGEAAAKVVDGGFAAGFAGAAFGDAGSQLDEVDEVAFVE